MNDDPRAALVQRLMQVQQTGDPRHVLEPTALHTAELLARQTGDEPATAELLGWFHLYRYLALPAGADSDARVRARRSYGLLVVFGSGSGSPWQMNAAQEASSGYRARRRSFASRSASARGRPSCTSR